MLSSAKANNLTPTVYEIMQSKQLSGQNINYLLPQHKK